MINIIAEVLSYPFLRRAMIVGLLVSLCAALLGVSLLLKRYSMIGDGLSHVGFGALAVASVLNIAPMTLTMPVVIIAAFLLLRISENSKIRSDAAIAIIATGSLALGVLIVSLCGTNTDLNNYLFGSILTMSDSDVVLSIIMSALVLIAFIFFYNKIFAITFDENFARATGTRAKVYSAFIAVMTAITIVLGMRMMGTLLISSLIVFPPMTSMRICKRFKTVTIISAIVAILCYTIGVIFSYIFSTPTGASVVAVNVIVLCLFSIISLLTRKVRA